MMLMIIIIMIMMIDLRPCGADYASEESSPQCGQKGQAARQHHIKQIVFCEQHPAHPHDDDDDDDEDDDDDDHHHHHQ